MKEWIEAMRLRTLPAGVSGVIAGTACACFHHGFSVLPFLICLLFAILAQIASNFANEYYDYKNGFDRPGREGFRRGVTEGDIKPGAMKRATFIVLLVAVALGSSLIIWGGWKLIFIGLVIAVFVLAYSTGPYPISHHGLGEIAVIIFFGFVPVIFTQYVQTGILYLDSVTVLTSLAIGLLGANILIVNNYRDIEDDREAGKKTSAVILGAKITSGIYLTSGVLAAISFAMASSPLPFWVSAGWLAYITFHISLWSKLRTSVGKQLNPILRSTALLMLVMAIYLLIIFCSVRPSVGIVDNPFTLP